MFVGKQFDIVLGVDIHIIQPPGPVPPVPIPHPFVGMVYDPMEFVPILGASIQVNGIPRAQAGTTVKATVPHIPIGGVFVKPPSNDGEIFMGSMTVPAESEPFPYLGSPVLTCQDAGMVSIPRPKRKSKSKPKSLVLPMSVLLPIPKGGMSFAMGALIVSLAVLAAIGLSKLGKLRKPPLRRAYEKEVRNLKKTAKKMKKAGKSAEEIARTVHDMRRKIGEKYKSLTPPDLLEKIYKRNLEKYGDKLGPSVDYLRKQGKSWDDIIESACRPGGKDIKFK